MFLVVQHHTDEHGESDVGDMVSCRDFAEVGLAILKARMANHDWAVFLMTDLGAKRVAVTFGPDGQNVVEIA